MLINISTYTLTRLPHHAVLAGRRDSAYELVMDETFRQEQVTLTEFYDATLDSLSSVLYAEQERTLLQQSYELDTEEDRDEQLLRYAKLIKTCGDVGHQAETDLEQAWQWAGEGEIDKALRRLAPINDEERRFQAYFLLLWITVDAEKLTDEVKRENCEKVLKAIDEIIISMKRSFDINEFPEEVTLSYIYIKLHEIGLNFPASFQRKFSRVIALSSYDFNEPLGKNIINKLLDDNNFSLANEISKVVYHDVPFIHSSVLIRNPENNRDFIFKNIKKNDYGRYISELIDAGYGNEVYEKIKSADWSINVDFKKYGFIPLITYCVNNGMGEVIEEFSDEINGDNILLMTGLFKDNLTKKNIIQIIDSLKHFSQTEMSLWTVKYYLFSALLWNKYGYSDEYEHEMKNALEFSEGHSYWNYLISKIMLKSNDKRGKELLFNNIFNEMIIGDNSFRYIYNEIFEIAPYLNSEDFQLLIEKCNYDERIILSFFYYHKNHGDVSLCDLILNKYIMKIESLTTLTISALCDLGYNIEALQLLKKILLSLKTSIEKNNSYYTFYFDSLARILENEKPDSSLYFTLVKELEYKNHFKFNSFTYLFLPYINDDYTGIFNDNFYKTSIAEQLIKHSNTTLLIKYVKDRYGWGLTFREYPFEINDFKSILHYIASNNIDEIVSLIELAFPSSDAYDNYLSSISFTTDVIVWLSRIGRENEIKLLQKKTLEYLRFAEFANILVSLAYRIRILFGTENDLGTATPEKISNLFIPQCLIAVSKCIKGDNNKSKKLLNRLVKKYKKLDRKGNFENDPVNILISTFFIAGQFEDGYQLISEYENEKEIKLGYILKALIHFNMQKRAREFIRQNCESLKPYDLFYAFLNMNDKKTALFIINKILDHVIKLKEFEKEFEKELALRPRNILNPIISPKLLFSWEEIEDFQSIENISQYINELQIIKKSDSDKLLHLYPMGDDSSLQIIKKVLSVINPDDLSYQIIKEISSRFPDQYVFLQMMNKEYRNRNYRQYYELFWKVNHSLSTKSFLSGIILDSHYLFDYEFNAVKISRIASLLIQEDIGNKRLADKLIDIIRNK